MSDEPSGPSGTTPTGVKIDRLAVESVSVSYGKAQVLFDVSLTVDAGECVALLGANGAGKTTLLRAVSGLLAVRDGRIRLHGNRIEGMSPEKVFLAGVSHVPEGRGLFPNLSVEDNVMLGGYHQGQRAARAQMTELLGMFPQITDRRPQLAGQLSGGEQQMVTIVRALMSGPKFLLLDEPTLGLAPAIRAQVLSVITDVARTGVGVLIVEQNAKQALAIADRCYVMRTGRITYRGSAGDALRDYQQLSDEYLGTVIRTDPS
jgi:branched-chain amino acid transport system ATP-binding protein